MVLPGFVTHRALSVSSTVLLDLVLEYFSLAGAANDGSICRSLTIGRVASCLTVRFILAHVTVHIGIRDSWL